MSHPDNYYAWPAEERMSDGTDREPTANKTQVGGDHYKHPGEEEHWDRAWRLNYDCFQYIITKWVERWKMKDGVEDLKKARHAIDKYIEVVEASGVNKVEPNPPDTMPTITHYDGTPVEDTYLCTCGSPEDDDPEWGHAIDCPARDTHSHPTPAERKWQMESIFQRLDNMEKEASVVKEHWQGIPTPTDLSPQRERVIDKDSNVRSNDYFTYEGGKANNDYWRCKSCLEHFTTGVGQEPGRVHNACPAEPSAGYVDQDPKTMCDHGRQFNEYCKPCGRVNSGG